MSTAKAPAAPSGRICEKNKCRNTFNMTAIPVITRGINRNSVKKRMYRDKML